MRSALGIGGKEREHFGFMFDGFNVLSEAAASVSILVLVLVLCLVLCLWFRGGHEMYDALFNGDFFFCFFDKSEIYISEFSFGDSFGDAVFLS